MTAGSRVPIRRADRSAAALLVLALAVITLGGCSTQRLGAAAVVGDTAIPMDRVDNISADVNAVVEGAVPTEELRATVLDQLIQTVLVREAANRLDTSVTDAEVARTVGQLAASPGQSIGVLLDSPRTAPFARQIVRTFLFRQAVGEELLRRRGAEGGEPTDVAAGYLARIAGQLGVEVDPRFGTWRRGAVVVGSGSLSTPAPPPAGSEQSAG